MVLPPSTAKATGRGRRQCVTCGRSGGELTENGIIGNRARFSETTVAVLGSEEYSRTRTDPMLGLGLSWKLNPSVSLDGRLDWTSTRLAPAPQSLIGGGSVPSHQWGLGLTAYF